MCHLSANRRFWIATLVSPIAAPAVASAIEMFVLNPGPFYREQFISVAEVSYALMLVVGVPAIYLCRKYQIFSFWTLLSIGTVIGASVGLYIERLLADAFINHDVDYFFILMYAALGTAVSITFGVIHGTAWRVGRVGDT